MDKIHPAIVDSKKAEITFFDHTENKNVDLHNEMFDKPSQKHVLDNATQAVLTKAYRYIKINFYQRIFGF